jgi:hypothetical protein
MAAYTSTWTWGNATGAGNLFSLTDSTTNSSATGYMQTIATTTGSTLNPFKVTTAGSDHFLIAATQQITIQPLYASYSGGTNSGLRMHPADASTQIFSPDINMRTTNLAGSQPGDVSGRLFVDTNNGGFVIWVRNLATGSQIKRASLNMTNNHWQVSALGLGSHDASNIFTEDSYIYDDGTNVSTLTRPLLTGGLKISKGPYGPNTIVLTSGSAIAITYISLASGEMTGGMIDFSIQVTDGTDHQVQAGRVSFSCVNKAGTFTSQIIESYQLESAANSTASTLTDVWTITGDSGNNRISILCNATTSLSASAGYPLLTYWVTEMTGKTITPQ